MINNRIHRLRERTPAWVNRRVLLLFLIIVVFTMAMAWGEPIPQAAAMQMGNIQKAERVVVVPAESLETNLSPDLMANREQTNGVISGSIVLTLIIIGASVSALYQKAHEQPR